MAGVSGVRYGELGYKAWEYHEKDIVNQSKNWKEISSGNPNIPLFIVGDFNQTRGIEKGYGTKKCRDLLATELKKSALECISEGDFENNHLTADPKRQVVKKNIDHICVSTNFISALKSYKVSAWNHFTEHGIYLSDHNGVYVDFEI